MSASNYLTTAQAESCKVAAIARAGSVALTAPYCNNRTGSEALWQPLYSNMETKFT